MFFLTFKETKRNSPLALKESKHKEAKRNSDTGAVSAWQNEIPHTFLLYQNLAG